MRVLVNAVSVKEGGSLVVLRNLLLYMGRQRPDIRWAVAPHPSVSLDLPNSISVERIESGPVDNSLGIIKWYEFGMHRSVRDLGIDVVFSITNYLPLRKLPCPTVLLEQHAGHFSPVFQQLHRLHVGGVRTLAWDLKTRWVIRSVRTATILTVQTSALADNIAACSGRHRASIRVIPHGPGLVSSAKSHVLEKKRGPFRLGYITKWGVQKNFAVLFDAVARLRAEGRHLRLVLTLDPALPNTCMEIAAAERAGIADVVENHGELGAAAVSDLYDSLDVFVFPSLAESFGFPTVEAMARGVPLLVADTPGNREVAGSGGQSFAPHDADDLAACIASLMDDPVARTAAGQKSAARSYDFSWDKAASQTLALLDEAQLQVRAKQGYAA